MTVCSFAQTEAENDFDPVRQHVAITAFIYPKPGCKIFVKELKLVNFSTLALLPEGFGLRGVTYADNGRNYDLVPGMDFIRRWRGLSLQQKKRPIQ